MKKILLILGYAIFLVFAIELILRVLCLQTSVDTKFLKDRIDHQYSIPLFNQEAAIFDSIMGFKWVAQEVKVLKIGNKKVEYDNQFQGNNLGYRSTKNYYPDSNSKYRILVFGDSFTDGYFLDKNWVESIEEMFQNEGIPVELYSLSINGGGIENWYSIYTHQIEGQFDFDAVVFAIFGNDLSRDFFSMHHEEQKIYLKYFAENEEIKLSNFNRNEYLNYIVSDQELLELKTYYSEKLNFFHRESLLILALENLLWHLKNVNNQKEDYIFNTYIRPNDEVISMNVLKGKYGERKMQLFEKLILGLQRDNKQVMLTTIPEKKGAVMAQETNPLIVKEVAFLCEYFNTLNYNGYEPYTELPEGEIATHFMEFDGHWNQKGSDYFTANFYPYLKEALDQ